MRQMIDNKGTEERHVDCNRESASDVPAAGEIRPAHKRADTRQEHPPTKRPRKGETGQDSLREARWRQPPAMICWEASDQHGKAKRHSFGSGVLRVGRIWDGGTWPRDCSCPMMVVVRRFADRAQPERGLRKSLREFSARAIRDKKQRRNDADA